jgi:hypothetical protein
VHKVFLCLYVNYMLYVVKYIVVIKIMKNKKLPASTIVETIMSMLLVFIAFGIGIGVYTNILRNDAISAQSSAATILQRLALEAKTKDRMLDETLTVANFRIEKKVSLYKGLANTNDLYRLELQAFDPNDRLICSHESLLYYPAK